MCLAGMGRIKDIEHARKFGYGYFEVNYPFVLAQKHVLLIREGDGYVERSPVKREDLQPVDAKCKCETCVRHCESYIAHLIECHEMTASVLITIHNLHAYVEYVGGLGE
jgi:tRNA-guanine family transglycosylase